MRLFFLLLLIFPLAVTAQDMAKYLEGKVPEVSGKVIFVREISVPQLSREQIFVRIAGMVQERFKTDKDEKGRILYSDIDEGSMVCWGEEYLVFTQKALVLDRAKINYQVSYTCKTGECVMEVSRIRYEYGESRKPIYAEEWITDEYAYDKKRNRLIRGSDKFRIKTIDLIDDLEKLLRENLEAPVSGEASIAAVPPTLLDSRKEVTKDITPETTQPPVGITEKIKEASDREGFQRILPTEINGNFVGMLMHGKLTMTAGDQKHQEITQWGGIGYLFGKPVLYAFVLPSRETVELENHDTYSLIWTPSSSAQSLYKELIIECRKMVTQSVSSEAISGHELKMEWSGKVLPKLYAGEIIAIWAR